jgi:thioredoxin 1
MNQESGTIKTIFFLDTIGTQSSHNTMEEKNNMKNIMGRFFSIALLLLVVASNVSAFISKQRNSNVPRRLISLAGASPNVVELGDSNFRELFKADKPILIDACAKWCGPCKLIEPTINRCADKRENSLAVCRYDVDSDSEEVKLELLLQRVMPKALPSLILIKNNKVLGTRNGIITDDELDEFLNEHLSKPSNVEVNEEIEENSKRIKTRGFIGFVNQVDDYMLNDDTF